MLRCHSNKVYNIKCSGQPCFGFQLKWWHRFVFWNRARFVDNKVHDLIPRSEQWTIGSFEGELRG